MKYTAIVQGKEVNVELDRKDSGSIQAKIGNREYSVEVQALNSGVYWMNCNSRSVDLVVMRTGDRYMVSFEGHHIPVEVIDVRAALRRMMQHQGEEGTAEMRAPMPGKIVRVLIDEGAPVQINQGILVMEAMKMQNEIKAPKNGIVRKIGVKEGEAVNSGDLLVIVE